MKIQKQLITLIIGIALSLAGLAQAVNANAAGFAQTASFNQNQVKDIQKIVHDYLVENPSVLVEASRALQKKQASQAQNIAIKAIKKNVSPLFKDTNSPVLGNTNGSKVIVEFFDYQCGHCRSMAMILNKMLKKDAKIKLILKDLPIFGDSSVYAAKASMAAWNQGKDKFLQFHEALLSTPLPLNQQKVLSAAQKVGLDVNKLKKDMKAKSINQQLRQNFGLAQKLQVQGTPFFVISNSNYTKFDVVPGQTSRSNMNKVLDAVQ